MKKFPALLLAQMSLLAFSFFVTACGGGGGGGGGGGVGDAQPAVPSISSNPVVPSVGNVTSSTSVGTYTSTTTSTTTSTVISSAIASCAPIRSAQVALEAVNAARAMARTCGSAKFPAVAPLQWSEQLASAALSHSKDMASRNFFAHTNPDGQTPFDRTAKAGYGPFSGENIGAGYPTLDIVMQGWLNSPGHCANIMRASYKDFALACAIPASSSTAYNIYWTQSFGSK